MYLREAADDRILVVLNLGPEPTSVSYKSGPIVGRLLVSSHLDRAGETVRGSFDLRGNEGAVVELSSESML
jgi:alpha-glucosidase